jgi:hypothetical protein
MEVIIMKIVVDFKNILSELELKKFKLCFLNDGMLYVEDNQNNLYQMENYRQGSYLDKLINDGITVTFHQVKDSISKKVEDWKKEIWDIPEVENFIKRQLL